MMIARKYRPKVTKVDDKENNKVARKVQIIFNNIFGIFVMLEKLRY